MEVSYSIIQKENEYRILLTPDATGDLRNYIQEALSSRKSS